MEIERAVLNAEKKEYEMLERTLKHIYDQMYASGKYTPELLAEMTMLRRKMGNLGYFLFEPLEDER